MIRRTRCRSLGALKRIHALMVIKGLNSDIQALRELLLSSVVSLYGTMDYARKVFEQIPQPDLFMWNTMIRGAAHSSTPSDAISFYSQMEVKGVRPDSFTFLFLLKACTRLSLASAGAQFHGLIVKLGFESDGFVRNALINLHSHCGDLLAAGALFDGPAREDVVARSALIAGYARRGELGIARKLFDEAPLRDLVTWNIMISGYAKRGEMETARDLFDHVPHRDIVSWNAMIAGYVLSGLNAQALEMYEEMRHLGERPDEATMVSLLSACANSGALDIGQRIHHSISEMCTKGGLSILLGNALIDMYAKCGSIEKALVVFREMGERDVWTWNSIIGGLAFHGHAKGSLNLFEEMQRKKVRPNGITFLGVMAACSHAGMVEEGRRYFSLMRNQYGLEPDVKHYGCMVDMLGRAGLLKEAFKLVSAMEIEPGPVIWRTLLGACRNHGNVELAERANNQLVKMREDASGDYVLLSNMFASVGKWGVVEKVRRSMEGRGVRKEAGRTLIQMTHRELLHFSFHS